MNFFSLIYICSTFIIRIFLRFKRNFGSPNPTTNFETTNPDFLQISYPILFLWRKKQLYWSNILVKIQNCSFKIGFYFWSYKPLILCNFLVFIFHLPDLKIILNFHFFYKRNLYYFLYGFFGHEKKTYLILCAAEEVLLLQ